MRCEHSGQDFDAAHDGVVEVGDADGPGNDADQHNLAGSVDAGLPIWPFAGVMVTAMTNRPKLTSRPVDSPEMNSSNVAFCHEIRLAAVTLWT